MTLVVWLHSRDLGVGRGKAEVSILQEGTLQRQELGDRLPGRTVGILDLRFDGRGLRLERLRMVVGMTEVVAQAQAARLQAVVVPARRIVNFSCPTQSN